MLRTDLPDHRRATEAELVSALRSRDPLALAEAYHRTIPAAHATARRLLAGSAEVEALLREVYGKLWSSPPQDEALEGWMRKQCFTLAADDLRERDAAPASPSLTTLLPELPRSEVRYLDAAERALAELDEGQRRALLLAHDQGVSSEAQGEGAAEQLTGALVSLAGPEAGAEPVDPASCPDHPLLADWVLGLLTPDRAARVAEAAAGDEGCTALLKTLRRGRRRLEGLPPTPDMGQRVLVVVLAGAPAPVPAGSKAAATPGVGAAGLPSALDAGTGAAAASPAEDDGEDTGDFPAVGSDDEGTGERRDPDAVYAELSELDETGDADHPVDLGEHDDDHEPVYSGSGGRSLGGRVIVWLLGALFMLAGIGAGLYLGLTLLR